MSSSDSIQPTRIHPSFRHAWLVAACIATLGTGCASMNSSRVSGKELARYQAVAGAPVDSMSFWRLDSWEPLDDEHLVVWTSPREAYLLKVWQVCNWMVVAPDIALTSSEHRVYANLDKVLAPNHQQCQIGEIRPIDVAALKRARAAERAAQSPSAK